MQTVALRVSTIQMHAPSEALTACATLTAAALSAFVQRAGTADMSVGFHLTGSVSKSKRATSRFLGAIPQEFDPLSSIKHLSPATRRPSSVVIGTGPVVRHEWVLFTLRVGFQHSERACVAPHACTPSRG